MKKGDRVNKNLLYALSIVSVVLLAALIYLVVKNRECTSFENTRLEQKPPGYYHCMGRRFQCYDGCMNNYIRCRETGSAIYCGGIYNNCKDNCDEGYDGQTDCDPVQELIQVE